MTTTKREAPAFDPTKARSDYPLSGRTTGPAWRAAWAALQDAPSGKYLDSVILAQQIKESTGVPDGTTKNLLMRAYVAGILEREYRLVPTPATGHHRRRAFYRIAEGHQ